MTLKKCCFLESAYSSNLTSTVINTDDLLPASIKKTVLELDRSRILSDAEDHASQSYVLEVAKAGAWPKFWDNALDSGPEATKSALANLQTLFKTCYSDQLCSAQNCSFEIPKGSAPCDHFIQCHTNMNCSANTIVSNILLSLKTLMYYLALDVHYIHLYSQCTSLSHQSLCIISSFLALSCICCCCCIYLYILCHYFCFTLCTSCAPISGAIEMKLCSCPVCVCVCVCLCVCVCVSVCVCVYVCVSVRSFLPPHASRPRNIGTYVFTATRKNLL